MTALTRRHHSGVTLIELIVTVAVLAILLSLAAPTFRDLLAAQRIRAAAHSLVSDLVLARSEAVKRGASVTLTPTAGNWADGWSVTAGAGADVLSAQNALGSGLGLSVSVPDSLIPPPAVEFDRNGRSGTSSMVRFQLSYLTTPKRCITLDLLGRPKSANSACPP